MKYMTPYELDQYYQRKAKLHALVVKLFAATLAVAAIVIISIL